MKIKQKNIRSFHIILDDSEDFFNYFSKNLTLMKNYFILLEGKVSNDIIDFLNNNFISYKILTQADRKILNINKKENMNLINENLAQEFILKENQEELENITLKKSKIFDRTIRSGEEIFSENDIIINGRVNSGAKIVCNSNMIINDKIDGFIECNGEYMIIKDIRNGVVTFNNEAIVVKSNNKSKLIYLKQGELVVKDIK